MSVTIISVTFGFPSVIVSVLSNTIVFILCAVSRATPLFINTPYSAPLPVPTIIAVGVARPKAQGQAITRTDINMVKANTPVSPPNQYQAAAERIEIVITIGTK
ncbi:hypothetical protein SDC9_186261 [bioreactor metagenome]|uniref:Uncharacterized protein n=1 Tax=bioreactor metagenome TaxID=1076179 RepID=A0A645HJF9_9ZZZZ